MQAPYPSGEIVEKPWGTEKWIDCNDHYAVRELLIRKGHAVSLQYHEKKLETLYVLQGRAIYTTQDEQGRLVEREVGPGDIMKNYPFVMHRQRALEDFRFIEVTTPELDDIIRVEDDYHRGSHTL